MTTEDLLTAAGQLQFGITCVYLRFGPGTTVLPGYASYTLAIDTLGNGAITLNGTPVTQDQSVAEQFCSDCRNGLITAIMNDAEARVRAIPPPAGAMFPATYVYSGVVDVVKACEDLQQLAATTRT